MGITGRCQSFQEQALSEAQRRLSSLRQQVLGARERPVEREVQAREGRAHQQVTTKGCAVYYSLTPKLALEVRPGSRKGPQTPEGPSPPLRTRAGSRKAEANAVRSFRPGTELSRESRVSQCQSLNPPIRGPSRGHNEQARVPWSERALQARRQHLGSLANTTTLGIGEGRARWESTPPFSLPNPPCLSHIICHRSPVWEVHCLR